MSKLSRLVRFDIRHLASTMLAFCLYSTAFAAAADSISYMPEFHGVFRGRWEMLTESGEGRFQVRNARLSAEGRVAPIIGYKFNIDLCDRGKIVILDAFARIAPLGNFGVKVGQFRQPFGMDSFRAPGGYYFNNRSFIGKTVNNIRGVGLAAEYRLPRTPLTLEAGVFNPTVITDHTRWTKTYAYAAKAVYSPAGFKFSAGAESLKPDSVRINLLGASAGWGVGKFYVEGEYMYRHYTHRAHKGTNAYNFFASYGIPLKHSIFDTWSWQARYDGMTDLSSGFRNDAGQLTTTSEGRRRITLGTTLDYRYRLVRAAVRLNFEHSFYQHKAVSHKDGENLLSAELIVKF